MSRLLFDLKEGSISCRLCSIYCLTKEDCLLIKDEQLLINKQFIEWVLKFERHKDTNAYSIMYIPTLINNLPVIINDTIKNN